jgi:hypothetical protein
MLDGRAVRSLGTQRHARRVRLCQRKRADGSVPTCRMSHFFLRYRRQADEHLPSLIYQLLEYERALKSGGANSPTLSDRSSIVAAEEAEWGRRRSMLDNDASDADVEEDRDVAEVAREARALDKAMEDRMLARKSSSSSVASSGLGMGVAWKSRYGGRRRTGSIASNLTNGSILSEDLVEEEEEEELLNVGGGFDNDSRESDATSPDSQCEEDSANRLPFTPHTARPSWFIVTLFRSDLNSKVSTDAVIRYSGHVRHPPIAEGPPDHERSASSPTFVDLADCSLHLPSTPESRSPIPPKGHRPTQNPVRQLPRCYLHVKLHPNLLFLFPPRRRRCSFSLLRLHPTFCQALHPRR